MASVNPNPISGRLVHEFLAHSYFVYLASVVIGLGIDFLWPLHFSFPHEEAIGVIAIILGTILAAWAQYASGNSAHLRNIPQEDIRHHHFKFGPYTYTRTPTQYGLLLMVVGLALLCGFTFMLLTAVIAFVVGKFFFIPKQEEHLAKRYGAAYLEYKKQVKF